MWSGNLTLTAICTAATAAVHWITSSETKTMPESAKSPAPASFWHAIADHLEHDAAEVAKGAQSVLIPAAQTFLSAFLEQTPTLAAVALLRLQGQASAVNPALGAATATAIAAGAQAMLALESGQGQTR